MTAAAAPGRSWGRRARVLIPYLPSKHRLCFLNPPSRNSAATVSTPNKNTALRRLAPRKLEDAPAPFLKMAGHGPIVVRLLLFAPLILHMPALVGGQNKVALTV